MNQYVDAEGKSMRAEAWNCFEHRLENAYFNPRAT